MVGSVPTELIHTDGDFDALDPEFFSTSQAGQDGTPSGSPKCSY
ncbi:MAG: hypothetical protein AAEJ52_07845 [Myxococcota bacterium]